MKRSRHRRSGFTLIELLTVIAIIGILFALTASTLPGILERSKIASLNGIFNQMRTVLIEYFTDNASYPPAYGYIGNKKVMFSPPEDITIADFVTEPYMAQLHAFGNNDLYDPFSESTDTDRNDNISSLEFSPLGQKVGVGNHEFFKDGVYLVSEVGSISADVTLGREVQEQLKAVSRPLVYIPVNARQVKKASEHWFALADRNGNNNGRFDDDNPRPNPNDQESLSIFEGMRFPPAKYDAYVLISVGPDANTRGLLFPQIGRGFGGIYHYHVLGIMAYFMATRDADDNGELDFDFLARTRGDEAENTNNQLPDPNAPNAAGPIISLSP